MVVIAIILFLCGLVFLLSSVAAEKGGLAAAKGVIGLALLYASVNLSTIIR